MLFSLFHLLNYSNIKKSSSFGIELTSDKFTAPVIDDFISPVYLSVLKLCTYPTYILPIFAQTEC